MHNITLISTVHRENGKCNSDELCRIIESISPDVIFLEALEENYSKYDQMIFSQSGVYNERLEFKTLQKYGNKNKFEYVPVLDFGLSGEFQEKIKIVAENPECQRLIDSYNSLQLEGGFQFLNSEKSVVLQENMRALENLIINNELQRQKVDSTIDDYENSMIRNIYSYCKMNTFKTAIFMCGVAHRKSIIKKIQANEKKSEINLNWTYYEA